MKTSRTFSDKSQHFHPTAQVLHWLMAIMIVAMLFIGAGMMTSVYHRLWLISLHRPLGIAILLLAIVRLANRLYRRPPPLPATVPHWQALGAKGSHVLLYGLMLAMPLIGWALLSAGGLPVVMASGVSLPPILAPDPVLYAWLRDAHRYLAWLLFVVVLVHLSAALLHAWVLRDGVFSSMTRRPRRF